MQNEILALREELAGLERIEAAEAAYRQAIRDKNDLIHTKTYKEAYGAFKEAFSGVIAFQNANRFSRPTPKGMLEAYERSKAVFEELVMRFHEACVKTHLDLDLALIAKLGPWTKYDARVHHFDKNVDEKTFLGPGPTKYDGERENPAWKQYREIVKLLVERRHIPHAVIAAGDGDSDSE